MRRQWKYPVHGALLEELAVTVAEVAVIEVPFSVGIRPAVPVLLQRHSAALAADPAADAFSSSSRRKSGQ